METKATLSAIGQETPTVKSFVLEVEEDLSFLPGQYIDLFIETPEGTAVGGYSITSSPSQKRSISIAVKSIPGAGAASHLHEKARIGDVFHLKGPGGEFCYRREMGSSLVLIAGGIGITPFISMIRHIHDSNLDVEVTLLYSARRPSELAFRRELEAISAGSPNIRCVFTVTRPAEERWEGRTGRVDEEMLREHAAREGNLFFICGPGDMPRQISETLKELGVDGSRIKTETW